MIIPPYLCISFKVGFVISKFCQNLWVEEGAPDILTRIYDLTVVLLCEIERD